jgi:hypothetical protein
MNFGSVLTTITDFLAGRGHRSAVIGGVALVSYGLPRTTLDLDFVVDAEVQEDLVRFLEELGYRTLHRSSGYSNHEHPDASWGGVDVLYVRGETSEKIFADSRSQPGPQGLAIVVPKPEHLAALKVQAIKNDPTRTFQDLADIRFLLQLPGVDRREVREYFERHGLEARFDEIQKSL